MYTSVCRHSNYIHRRRIRTIVQGKEFRSCRLVSTVLYNQGVLGSNVGPVIGYPDWGFCGFLQPCQVDSGLVRQIRRRPFPSTASQVHYSLITLCSTLQMYILCVTDSVVKWIINIWNNYKYMSVERLLFSITTKNLFKLQSRMGSLLNMRRSTSYRHGSPLHLFVNVLFFLLFSYISCLFERAAGVF